MDLLVGDKIAALYLKDLSFRTYLADLTLDVMHAVLFNGSAIELIKGLARSPHIDIEHIDLRIRILVSDKHCMLGRIHTADLGAVLFTLAGTCRAS